jgi:hypothetical protein
MSISSCYLDKATYSLQFQGNRLKNCYSVSILRLSLDEFQVRLTFKGKIKSLMYAKLSLLLAGTLAYQSWMTAQLHALPGDGDGRVNVDLPAMGANPKRRDIFVEIDWMEGCPGTSSRKPLPAALNQVVAAFASYQIGLHVDYGQGGAFKGGNSVRCIPNLAWPNDFKTIKNVNFSRNRQGIFHYNIWGNTYYGTGNNPASTGTAEKPGDDFLVTLGSTGGTQPQQAGTFMHELGHNLGLDHGGTTDSTGFKPNHLSVMNISFQFKGLIFGGVPGKFDYARFSPPALNESALNETIGLNAGSAFNLYGTIWYCNGLRNERQETSAINKPINWNCKNNDTETNVAAKINVDGQLSTLSPPGVEWSFLQLAGLSGPGIYITSTIPSLRISQTPQESEVEKSEVIIEAPFEVLEREQRATERFFERLKPSQPQQVKAQRVGINSVSITWKLPRVLTIDGKPIVEYEVWKQEGDNIYTKDLLGTTKNLSFMDNSVVRGKTYVYSVTSSTAGGRGSAAFAAPIYIP